MCVDIVKYGLGVYLQTCANANVEPSGHCNARNDENKDVIYAPFSEGVPSEWPYLQEGKREWVRRWARSGTVRARDKKA